MASKVLRCFLLIFFIFVYSYSADWYQHTFSKDRQHSPAICNRPHDDLVDKECQQFQKTNDTKSFLIYAVRSSNSSFACCLEKTYNNVHSGNDVLPTKEAFLATSPASEIKTLVILKSDLLKISYMVINALTILDIVLSRRTKPWRFLLRVLYRVGRSNLKWGLLWTVFQLWSHFEGNKATDWIEVDIEQLPFSTVVSQMQHIWIALQSYPMLLALTFFIYNLAVSWIVHLMKRRNDNHNITAAANSETDPHLATADVTNGARNVRRRILSRWSLLIDCFFRPLSFDTAHSLMDFELDENVEQLIERLALPNLWLTPTVPTDYLKYLPVWRFDGCSRNAESPSTRMDSLATAGTVSINYIETTDNGPNRQRNDDPPLNMKWIPSADCAICLDKYRFTVDVCGLPCGHQFHHNCIMVWLQRDNHHCPICRWPAYQNKYLCI